MQKAEGGKKKKKEAKRGERNDFNGLNLETNILLTDNMALENIPRAERLLDAEGCDRNCLDPSRPRIVDQLQPTKEVEGEERERMPCKNSVAPGLIGRGLAFFRNETTKKKRKTGNTITPTEKCVKQVASSLASRSHSPVMNRSCSQRRRGWLVSQKV